MSQIKTRVEFNAAVEKYLSAVHAYLSTDAGTWDQYIAMVRAYDAMENVDLFSEAGTINRVFNRESDLAIRESAMTAVSRATSLQEAHAILAEAESLIRR